MGYVYCQKCEGYYKLQKDEFPEDFLQCQCNGRLIFIEDLDDISSAKIFCPYCKTGNLYNSEKCVFCGKNLDINLKTVETDQEEVIKYFPYTNPWIPEMEITNKFLRTKHKHDNKNKRNTRKIIAGEVYEYNRDKMENVMVKKGGSFSPASLNFDYLNEHVFILISKEMVKEIENIFSREISILEKKLEENHNELLKDGDYIGIFEFLKGVKFNTTIELTTESILIWCNRNFKNKSGEKKIKGQVDKFIFKKMENLSIKNEIPVSKLEFDYDGKHFIEPIPYAAAAKMLEKISGIIICPDCRFENPKNTKICLNCKKAFDDVLVTFKSENQDIEITRNCLNIYPIIKASGFRKRNFKTFNFNLIKLICLETTPDFASKQVSDNYAYMTFNYNNENVFIQFDKKHLLKLSHSLNDTNVSYNLISNEKFLKKASTALSELEIFEDKIIFRNAYEKIKVIPVDYSFKWITQVIYIKNISNVLIKEGAGFSKGYLHFVLKNENEYKSENKVMFDQNSNPLFEDMKRIIDSKLVP